MAPTPRTARRFPRLLSLTSVVAAAVCAPPAPASYGDGDWPACGRDAGGSKNLLIIGVAFGLPE